MSDNRVKKVWFVGWFASMLLASCGVKNQDVTISTLETTYDWKQQGFVTEGQYEEQQLFVVNYEDRPIAYVGTRINCDERGNIYIGDEEQHSIYLLDEEGKLITHYTYQADEKDNVIQSFRTDTGEVIFAFKSGNKISYIWINPENGEEKQLAVTDWEYVREYYGIYDNVLYYATKDSLIGWNIATGEKQILFDIKDYEITDTASVCFMRTGESGKLLVTENEKRYILSLDVTEAEVAEEIVVANTGSANSFLKGRVFNFSKENPLYGISYEEAYESEEDVARVLMEVANGKGPDILYVSGVDMENLYEKNALGDLKQLLSAETIEVLLPGAIQMGTLDVELVGLPLSVSIRTTITNKEYWQANAWTVQDVLALLEEREEAGIFIDYFGQDTFFYNMFFLTGINMVDTSYLKAEAGFHSAEFQEVLRIVKERTGKIRKMNSFAEFAEALKAGEMLSMEAKIHDIRSFATAYDKIGPDTCFVGYPTESGNGNYMESGGLLVVNQAAIEKEGVKELVQYLFDKDSQKMVKDAISVRWDLPAEQLQYHASTEQYFWVYPEGQNVLLPEKYDGSSYLEEYVDFIKGAVPYEALSEPIFNIVMEEAESYFKSDKDINEVTNTIQSRVELYQEEHR